MDSKRPQSLTVQLPYGGHSLNMSGIQPYVWSFLNIWFRNSCSITSIFLHCLTMSHFYSNVLSNLLHSCVDLIRMKVLWILLLRWFPMEWHLRVYTLHGQKWGTLCRFKLSIIRGTHSHGKLHHQGIRLMVHTQLKVLLHTRFLSFHWSICLHQNWWWHQSIHPQAIAYLFPACGSILWSPIGNNRQWESIEVYYLP
jgi:hypothetical protein